MKRTNLLLSTILFLSVTLSIGWVAEVIPARVHAAIAITDNGCGCDSCNNRRKIFRKCPKCNNDFCTLKCENKAVKKNCFDIDQKVVCIPKVTWPWEKCCKPCAKTRTVNVLKIKQYECCECKYTWSLYEHPLPKTRKQIEDEQQQQMQKLQPLQESQDAQKPGFEDDGLYDPGGSDVPTPPNATNIKG